MPDESTPLFKSSLPELRLPAEGFQSSLPPHLLEGADEQTRYIMNEISRNSAATEFACRAAVTHNEHLRTLNGRTGKNEKHIGDTESDVKTLKEQVSAASPLFKPVAMFVALWEYRAFRWVFYGAAFFFFTYLLPWYLKNPISIETIVNHLLGS